MMSNGEKVVRPFRNPPRSPFGVVESDERRARAEPARKCPVTVLSALRVDNVLCPFFDSPLQDQQPGVRVVCTHVGRPNVLGLTSWKGCHPL